MEDRIRDMAMGMVTALALRSLRVGCTVFDADTIEAVIREHLPPGVFVPEICKCGKPMEPPTMCYLCLCGVPLAERKRGVFVPMELASRINEIMARAHPPEYASECYLCQFRKLVEAAKGVE